MGSRSKVLATFAFAGACALLVLPSAASAAPSGAPSGVTIHLRTGDELKGFVFSQKPNKCADGRTVKVFREKGKGQNPDRDAQVGKTQASKRGSGKYRWIVDLNRPRPGKYYAGIPATSVCQGNTSKAIRISSRPDTKINQMISAHRKATFEYYAVGGVSPYDFQCKLDDHPYQPCRTDRGRATGSHTYRNLSRGRHVFQVRATGSNGKTDRTPAKQSFHIPQ
jgi:hypothetical protein